MQKSSDVTVLTDSTIAISGHWTKEEPYINAEEIKEILGWEVKPEGLCKEDTCIPIDEHKDLEDQGRYSLREIANLTGHPRTCLLRNTNYRNRPTVSPPSLCS